MSTSARRLQRSDERESSPDPLDIIPRESTSGRLITPPPATESEGRIVSFTNTPRALKPIKYHTQQIKQDANNMGLWDSMTESSLQSVVSPEVFFQKYLPPTLAENPETIRRIVKEAAPALAQANVTLEPHIKRYENKEGRDENVMSEPFITYGNVVLVASGAGAYLKDTHRTKLPTLKPHPPNHTSPDFLSRLLGTDNKKLSWYITDLTGELKWDIDIITDEGTLSESEKAVAARAQLCKSARNLLMALGRCHVYVLTIFAIRYARIFRFDRAGFIATTKFNWLEHDIDIFPRFFFRVHNPSTSLRMDGLDDTITFPEDDTVAKLWKALSRHPYYSKTLDEKTVTNHCLRIAAARRVGDPLSYEQELVHCLTVGEILSVSDGLFGRATRVYRVIIEEDLDKDGPPAVYALKDVWRQACRRPEADFYDLIEHHCETAEPRIDMDAIGMARCRGSIDLSDATSPLFDKTWDPALHKTRFGVDNERQRLHTRTLLTPVGSSIENFPSTKRVIEALLNVSIHLKIAYDAGIIHRDVSVGNILFVEDTSAESSVAGFLVDWDYAEVDKRRCQTI
ncbi:Protein kinase domain-containing protein [Mycena indigotica]|uniref:Protein kinase domain-containing protein n=1 Tax=Mycena indigotica TaxID=2126181 RepID=A0A8H6VZE6_9AGAR|nr:Protein kinase domain-containing protein [Mycena indigotica]KAF7299372.1 Protein kinase domain-containing protein [Mycena indigotica]